MLPTVGARGGSSVPSRACSQRGHRSWPRKDAACHGIRAPAGWGPEGQPFDAVLWRRAMLDRTGGACPGGHGVVELHELGTFYRLPSPVEPVARTGERQSPPVNVGGDPDGRATVAVPFRRGADQQIPGRRTARTCARRGQSVKAWIASSSSQATAVRSSVEVRPAWTPSVVPWVAAARAPIRSAIRSVASAAWLTFRLISSVVTAPRTRRQPGPGPPGPRRGC